MLALTKVDLPYDEGEVARVRELYGALGHRVIPLSLRTGEGLEELRVALADRVAVLAGHSGVGKTSLTNALTGRTDATGDINPVGGRGRHTTTGARYMDLPGGGALIDTAGIRSFGIAGVAADDLQKAFPEIAAAAEDCEWEGCLHREGEDGCAVEGAPGVSAERLASYRKLLSELEELEAERELVEAGTRGSGGTRRRLHATPSGRSASRRAPLGPQRAAHLADGAARGESRAQRLEQRRRAVARRRPTAVQRSRHRRRRRAQLRAASSRSICRCSLSCVTA